MKTKEIILSGDIRAYHWHTGEFHILHDGHPLVELDKTEAEKLRSYFKSLEKYGADDYTPGRTP